MSYFRKNIFNSYYHISINDLKSFISFSFGSITSSLFLFLTVREVNSHLPSEILGEYSYYQSIFQLLFVLFSLNLYNIYPRFLNNGAVVSLVSFVQKFNFFAVILLSGLIYYFTKSFLSIFYSGIIIYYERMYFYRSISKVWTLNFLMLSTSLVTYIMVLGYFEYAEKYNFNFIYFAHGLGYCVSFIFLSRIKHFDNAVESEIKTNDAFVYCLPLLGMTIVEWVLNFSNQFLIKHFLDFDSVAVYAIGFKALFPFRFLVSLFLLYFPVIYYREVAVKNAKLIKSYRSIILVVLFISSLLLCFFSEQIYFLIGGSEYLTHIYVFQLLLFSDLFRVSASFFSLFLTYKILTFQNFLFNLLASVVCLILSLILIPKFGVIGACLSMLFSFFILFVSLSSYSCSLEKKYFNE